MDNVVPLRKCRCGAPGRPRVLVFRDQPGIPFVACDACVAAADADLAKARKVFEALLGMGISRKVANAMMIAKLEAEG